MPRVRTEIRPGGPGKSGSGRPQVAGHGLFSRGPEDGHEAPGSVTSSLDHAEMTVSQGDQPGLCDFFDVPLRLWLQIGQTAPCCPCHC